MRAWINRWRRKFAHLLLYRRVFGERSGGRWLSHTRISPSTCIDGEAGLVLADHVYIGPFNWIDAAAGVTIEEGVQITTHVSIVSHSSHRAMRLLGRDYVQRQGPMPGWVSGPVVIGAYCFIGPHVLIEAGTRVGRGCIVRAGSVLRGDFAEFSVIEGNPARVVADAREGDAALLARHPELQASYDAWAGQPPR